MTCGMQSSEQHSIVTPLLVNRVFLPAEGSLNQSRWDSAVDKSLCAERPLG